MSVKEGSPFPRGATWDGKGVNFSLFSSHATAVELCVFDAAGSRELEREVRVATGDSLAQRDMEDDGYSGGEHGYRLLQASSIVAFNG